MNIRGIIFDLDGVICSTDEYHYLAWKQMADEEGIDFDRKVNERLRGVSRAESLEIILEGARREYTDEEKDSMMERKNSCYREFLSGMNPDDVSREVRETLEELRRKGYRLAIGSSSRNTAYILERIGLSDFFDDISDGPIIARSKPDPEVFIKAAGMLHLRNEDCLVIEDAPAGIDAANAGGFVSVGIGSAASYDRASYRVEHFADILNIAENCADAGTKSAETLSALL